MSAYALLVSYRQDGQFDPCLQETRNQPLSDGIGQADQIPSTTIAGECYLTESKEMSYLELVDTAQLPE